MVLITTTLVASMAGLILALAGIFFILDLLQRTEKRLSTSYNYMLFAVIIFAIGEILIILKELFFIRIGPLHEASTIIFMGLLVTSLWSCRYAIREVDGSLKRK